MLLKVPSLLLVLAFSPQVAMPATVTSPLNSECSRAFYPDYRVRPEDNLRGLSARLRVMQSRECERLASVDELQSRRALVALLSSLNNAVQYAYTQGMSWGELHAFLEGEGIGDVVLLAPDISLYGFDMEDFLAFYREQRNLVIDLMLADDSEDGRASLTAALHDFKVNLFYANIPSLQPHFHANPLNTPEENVEEFQARLRDFRYHFVLHNSDVSAGAVRLRYVSAIVESLPVISEYCRQLNCNWANFNLFFSFVAQMSRHGITEDQFLACARDRPMELTQLLSADYADEEAKALAVADFIRTFK